MRILYGFMKVFRNSSTRKILKGSVLAGGLLSSFALYSTLKWKQEIKPFALIAACASKINPQGSAISETKSHALYLTIHIDPKYSQDCLKTICQIKKYVDAICPPDLRDENDEILYGVGFGSDYYQRIQPNQKNADAFHYRSRSGCLGDMPSTGGDIFIHAKCNERGKLFELAQTVLQNMPHNAVVKFEDIYGWVYRNGRDLSGFIDGTANPADPDERFEVAINSKTGGSFAVVQKWIHNHDFIRSTNAQTKENWIGRTLPDSIELPNKTGSSHVARMVGTGPEKRKIVRQSQPYGTLAGDSGLLFIGYSSSTDSLNWMLDRMTGEKGTDGKCDDVMRMTRCVTGNYWYFPSQSEFDNLVGGVKLKFWR